MAANPSKSEIIFKLYSRLKQSPCTIAVLEDWKQKNGYQFANRSLYRYLDELAANLKVKGESIEVYKGEFNKKTWKLVYNKSANDIALEDIHTFYLSKLFIPSDMQQQRRKSFQKLELGFYEQASKGRFELSADAFNLKMQNTNFYEARYTKAQQKTIDQLIWAIQNHRMLLIESLSPHVDLSFNRIDAGHCILPLSLQQHRGVLHLCGYNLTNNQIVVIAFDTLASFTATNESFNPQKYAASLARFFDTHFGVSPNIDNAVYHIELEFAGSTGGFVSGFFWHNSQQTKLLKNGNLLFFLQCGINRELVGWIFQWMNNVRVRKPLKLRKMVVELHQKCINANNAALFDYNNSFLQK